MDVYAPAFMSTEKKREKKGSKDQPPARVEAVTACEQAACIPDGHWLRSVCSGFSDVALFLTAPDEDLATVPALCYYSGGPSTTISCRPLSPSRTLSSSVFVFPTFAFRLRLKRGCQRLLLIDLREIRASLVHFSQYIGSVQMTSIASKTVCLRYTCCSLVARGNLKNWRTLLTLSGVVSVRV